MIQRKVNLVKISLKKLSGQYFANAGQTDGRTDGQTDGRHAPALNDRKSLRAYKKQTNIFARDENGTRDLSHSSLDRRDNLTHKLEPSYVTVST